jgi:sugar-specific transcriptional regulator TrmB
VYITLLKIGLESPAKIAEKSNVDRARVYDSLKRLVKRAIVEEEPVPRAPRYRALKPSVVFERIRKEYENRIQMSSNLEKDLENLKLTTKEQDSVWAIQNELKIMKKIEQFVDEANDFIFLILTPDWTSSIKEMVNIADKILEKRRNNSTITIKVAMAVVKESITSEYKSIISRLFHANIDLLQWNAGAIIPFGLVMTETNFLQTYLSSINPKPQYEFGIFMENISLEKRLGLQHLCLWFYTYLCKKIVFVKKSKTDKDYDSSDEMDDDFESDKFNA